MSTNNIGFYEELKKIVILLSSNTYFMCFSLVLNLNSNDSDKIELVLADRSHLYLWDYF